MDPLRLCLALGPPAVYLLLVGAINLSRRAWVVSGPRDLAALGVALAGPAVIGPIELFFPYSAAAAFGPYVWVLLLGLYFLCIILLALVMRPRLVVYNISSDEARDALTAVASRLEREVLWSGDSIQFPDLGVQLGLEPFPAMRNVTLLAVGRGQSPHGWARLERALAEELHDTEVAPNLPAIQLILAATITLVFLGIIVCQDPQAMTAGILDLLQFDASQVKPHSGFGS
ncbi:MAG: hypothetical protein ACOY3P_20840 [Planctomycetota bacterium]